MAKSRQCWERIVVWLKEHAEAIADGLTGPASEEAIAEVEETIGMTFPDDLRESYLTQDGLEYGETELNIFMAPPGGFDDMAFCLLPIDEVAAEWAVWKDLIDGGDFDGAESEPDDAIQNTWWSDGWIPVASNGGGDFICVDMKPSETGSVGQVICAWHDMDERKLVAGSWSAYLESLVQQMEADQVTYSSDEGLVRKNE